MTERNKESKTKVKREAVGPRQVNSSVAWQSLRTITLSKEVLPECDSDAEEN